MARGGRGPVGLGAGAPETTPIGEGGTRPRRPGGRRSTAAPKCGSRLDERPSGRSGALNHAGEDFRGGEGGDHLRPFVARKTRSEGRTNAPMSTPSRAA